MKLRQKVYSIVLLLAVIASMVGCATSKKIEDNSTIDQKTNTLDSTDTKHKESAKILDGIKSLQVNSDSKTKTEIIFSESGGSYNTNTGDADGVSKVYQEQEVTVDSTAIEYWRDMYFDTYNQLTSVRDSLTNLMQRNDIKTEKESKSTWWAWLLIGAVGMFAIIVVLKKTPQTSWLLFWL